jgi:hypothetical protein
MAKYWLSPAPENCDICRTPIIEEFVDGKTNMGGKWGCLCIRCHKVYGFGLGLGVGQHYKKQEDGEWLKVGG